MVPEMLKIHIFKQKGLIHSTQQKGKLLTDQTLCQFTSECISANAATEQNCNVPTAQPS